jgi:uncharacterized protein YegP (UPF0339 family)
VYFTVGQNKAGNYTWWLHAANHEMVAWAGEDFASQYNANRAAASFKAGAFTARYEVYLDASQAWRWRAWRSSDRVAAPGESFSSKSAAEGAAESVRLNAGNAAL